jgi:hypothetical protein
MHKKITQLFKEYLDFVEQEVGVGYSQSEGGIIIAAAMLTQTHIENVPGALGIYPSARERRS